MSRAKLKVAVVGGGRFGQGLALAAQRNQCEVQLFTRRAEVPGGLPIQHDIGVLAGAELIFFAVPSQFVRSRARELCAQLDGRHLVVHVSRGLYVDGAEGSGAGEDGPSISTLSEVLKRETAARRVGVLAGPLSSRALLESKPGGAVVGSRFPEVTEAVRRALGSDKLRIYDSDDVVGVEVASALVGLLAFFVGYLKGAGSDAVTQALMASRGLTQLTPVGARLGADIRSFHGLAGTGDLMSALADDGRDELEIGRALGQGHSLDNATRKAGVTFEGPRMAKALNAYARRHGLRSPILDAACELLEGHMNLAQATQRLMDRPVARSA